MEINNSAVANLANVTGVLPVANGGTGLSSAGTNGTVLKTVSGAPAWAYPYSRVSKVFADSPYSVLSTDTHIDVDTSGGAVTVTVPAAAAGNAGQTIWIRKTTADFNAVTLATGVSTTLNTLNEELQINSNGSAWAVIQRVIPSVWTSFTPTGAWVSNTTFTGFWRRVGDSIRVQVRAAVTGAPTSATFTGSIPSGLTIDTAKLVSSTASQMPLGVCELQSATNRYNATVIYNNTTTVKLGIIRVATADTHISVDVTEAVPGTFANNDYVNLMFEVPVSGWN